MSTINTRAKSIWLMLGLGVMFGSSVAHAAATLTIPQVPLQTGSDVPANILFMLDDSGSMAWSFMPDSVYGVCNNNSSVTNRARGRSPDYNKTYFDPNVTYHPPLRPDGTPYTAASFPLAKINGYSETSSLVNLESQFRATWYYNSSSYSNRYCGGSGAADYYLFDTGLCSNVNNNSCYKRYIVSEQSTEIKNNFANWYSFYRTRLMSSKAGIGRAFQTLPETMRVGYGQINGSTKVERGVRAFEGVGKSQFYSWLYGKQDTTYSTPLKSALKAAGEYFKTDEPYRAEPENDSSGLVSCRQNFTVLMTDGYYTDENLGFSDSDGDGESDTLADIAHHYWATDLRPEGVSELENNVPSSSLDPANWQHMVTYGVGLGVDGTVPAEAINWASNDSRWPKPDSDPKKIDDLMHAGVNSKGGFFSAQDPDTFNAELTNTLRNIVNRVASASNLAATTTSLQEDNSVFQASFNTSSWSGDLVSRDVETLSVQWSANFPSWNERNIKTSRGSGASIAYFDFKWSNLTDSERDALVNENTVDYIRGSKVKEKTSSNPAGIFRERTSLLGDIAHSSPAYVAESQNRNYQRYNWTGAATYQAYLTATKSRTPQVYVGANDGMLHAFSADLTSGAAGLETFAYVPQGMLKEEARLADIANLDYEHRFYVDGSPIVADVYFDSSNSWRTVLIGTLGRGGEWIYALDVTNPAGVKVLWDIKIPELGIMPHKPIITRLNNGRWSVIAGYGYNNSADKSGLLVIDVENGLTTKLEISGAESIGLAQLEGWDHNKNGNTDWIFAGDIKGNVWKFDLSSSSPTSWHVGYGGTPLFVAKDSSGNRQPITGGVTLQSHPDTAELWVFFGTGKFIETGDSVNTDTQSFYGIKDGAMITSRTELVSRSMTNVAYVNPDTGENRSARSLPLIETNDMAGKRGWVMDLIDSRERITSKPRFIGGNLVINTIIPDSDLCNPQGDGWIMAVDPFQGSRLKYHFFDLSRDNEFKASDGLPDGTAASGVKFEGMPGEPVFVGDKKIVGTSKVALNASRVNLEIRRGRLSWREIIN